MVVCIVQQLPVAQSYFDPRDYSGRFDQTAPPAHGEPCFCMMVAELRKKPRWRPASASDVPPSALVSASLVSWFSRVRAAVDGLVVDFNQRQLSHGTRVEIWAVTCTGLGGCEKVARPIGGGCHEA